MSSASASSLLCFLLHPLACLFLSTPSVWCSLKLRALSRSPYANSIGSTPMTRLRSLSELLGVRVYVKREDLNPGGSGKDRVALEIIRECLSSGARRNAKVKGVVEGTSGSTGISLARLCDIVGIPFVCVVPDDQSATKIQEINKYNGKVIVTKNASISSPTHYCNLAKRISRDEGYYFGDQFDSCVNYRAHYTKTGPEILSQVPNGKVDHFVMSAGTGGTISGVGNCLKKASSANVILGDPSGSVLHGYVSSGVAYTEEQMESRVRKHRYDTIVEGVGMDRLTGNMKLLDLNDAGSGDGGGGEATGGRNYSYKVRDQDVVNMCWYVYRKEGMRIGSSTSLNFCALVAHAGRYSANDVVVTVKCDGWERHRDRLWNKEFIEGRGMIWPESMDIDDLEERIAAIDCTKSFS